MHVILLGPAGSGKGTLARQMAERDGFRVFETGALLREVAAQPTATGRALSRELAKGNMAPTALVMDVLAETLGQANGARYVLDGIPRNVEQAEAFTDLVALGRVQVAEVLVLEAERAVLRERLLSRRGCAACGSIYNLGGSGPFPLAGRCRCGGALLQREDDHEAAIERRFDLYDRMTVPAIRLLEAAGLRVRPLAAGGHPEATYEAARPPNITTRRLVAGRS